MAVRLFVHLGTHNLSVTTQCFSFGDFKCERRSLLFTLVIANLKVKKDSTDKHYFESSGTPLHVSSLASNNSLHHDI